MLETIIGMFLGVILGNLAVNWFFIRFEKAKKRRLKAEIKDLIYKNRHRHPAIILTRLQEHLEKFDD